MTEKIGFLGAGAIAEAIISGLVSTDIFSSQQLGASDINQERLGFLAEKYGVTGYIDNPSLVEDSQIVILAVKPQNIKEALSPLKDLFTGDKLVISFVAGVSIKTLYQYFPPEMGVARVMSNTPCLIRKGVSAVSFSETVDEEYKKLTLSILEAVGKVHVLPERFMDAVTGLSGSGPAYIFLIIEALSDAGVRAGLPREISLDLAVQTVIGSAMMVDVTKIHPAILKEKVITPAGTTIAALHILERAGIRVALMDAVIAATDRSAQLGSD